MASSLAEFERLAEEKLCRDKKGRGPWDMISLATGDGQTYHDSKRAFKRYRFQPRILSASPDRSLWTTVLGQPIRMPIGISPAISYSWFHAEADATAGRAAARAGTVMIVSSLSDLPIEEFAATVPESGLYWAQTYLFKDRRNTLHIVRNAERCGFKAIVVTVDSPVEHKRVGAVDPQRISYHESRFKTNSPNQRYMDGKERVFPPEYSQTLAELWHDGGPMHAETFCCPNWDDLAWLKSQTKLPIVLKGVLTAAAALQSVSYGISGILVSAHGGRQLDGSPAPLDVLPEIVNALKGTNIEVYMDGGVRTGNDVLKALALGARAVFIGRPVLYGLAVNGEEGIFQVLKILENELDISMALCGCSSIQEIDRSIVKHETEFHSRL